MKAADGDDSRVTAGRHPDGAGATIRARSRGELLAELGRRGLARAVADGDWIRARQGVYLPRGAPSAFVRAARIGGRLTCLSLLRHRGVFVQSHGGVHVHLPHPMSRMRDPDARRRTLAGRSRRGPVLHWHRSIRALPDDGVTVDPVDALAHAVRCQTPRESIASIDSALHTGFITESELDALFAALPRKYRVLRRHIDGRAESGPETLVRLMLRALGCTVDVQVSFAGVGRVDLVADGWLVVECDSKQFHSSWSDQLRDRARDAELAAQGFVTIRFTAVQIMHRPHEVMDALRGVLAARRQ